MKHSLHKIQTQISSQTSSRNLTNTEYKSQAIKAVHNNLQETQRKYKKVQSITSVWRFITSLVLCWSASLGKELLHRSINYS